MLYNIVGTLLFIIVTWLMGLTLLKTTGLTTKSYTHIHYISIPIGITICAIVATTMYFRIGLSVGAIRIAYGILSLLSIAVLVKKKVDKREVIGLLIIILLFAVMILPGILHGDKYYVHRGNLYDQYYYLSEVIYMSLHKISYGASGIMDAEGAVDVIRGGYNAIMADRPTVPLLCAVLTGKSWGNVFFQAYLFLTVVWSCVFGSVILALQMVTGAVNKKITEKKLYIAAAVLAIAYIWGFYGQIQYDIDAWSQLTSIGSLLAMVCVYFMILSDIINNKEAITAGRYITLLILGAGNFLIYPENTMIQGALLVVVSIIACIIRRTKIPLKTIGVLLTIPILAVAVAAAADFLMVKFSLSQVLSSGSEVRQSWASYFDKYWLGYHTFLAGSDIKAFIKKLVAFWPSIFGMFILTPNYEIRVLPVTIIWLAAVAFVCIGLLMLVVSSAKAFFSNIRQADKEQESFFIIYALVGLLIFAVMMFREKYWSAGKLLLYVSPALFIMLSTPARNWLMHVQNEKIRKKKKNIVYYVSILFVGCQLVFAGMRVYDTAVNADCIGYLGNYPSDQAPVLKQSFPYDFKAEDYIGEEEVAIAIDNTWYQDYIKISLAYEGIYYYAVPDYVFGQPALKDDQPELKEGAVIIQLGDESE